MKKVFLFVGIASLFYGCKKEISVQPNTPSQVDVYVAGWVTDTAQYYPEIFPTYWKNGEPIRLNFEYDMSDDVSKQGFANSIAVDGNDIYVAGHRKQYSYWGLDLTQGLYWKNGVATEYPGSDLNGINQLGQLLISNNDVYAVVREYLASGNIAQYLKNGNIITLDQGAGPDGSIATAIAISGNDIYVTGAALRRSYDVGPMFLSAAKYWKNGVPVNLTSGSAPAYAKAIAISGNDVHIAGEIFDGLFVPDGSGYPGNGYTNRRGVYWKNGTLIYLTDGSSDVLITSMAISGNDVYIAGSESDGKLVNGFRNYVAKYWKNGVPVNLTDGTNSAEAKSIAISGSDVYVAGLENDGKQYPDGYRSSVAKFWKNAAPVTLSNGSTDAAANSIFLAPR